MATVGALHTHILNASVKGAAFNVTSSLQHQGVVLATASRHTVRCESTVVDRPKAAEVKTVRVGQSSLHVPQVGCGTWSWGDKFFWNQGTWNEKSVQDAREAFDEAMDSGLCFFDTAGPVNSLQVLPVASAWGISFACAPLTHAPSCRKALILISFSVQLFLFDSARVLHVCLES
eukprot:jgi/Mesen1/4703/ME000241S03742